MEKIGSSRREFFKKIAFATAAGAMIQVFARNAKAAALQLIDMTGKKRTDPGNTAAVKTAKGLQYVEDLAVGLKDKSAKKEAKTVGAKTFKPEEQTCDTCLFFDMQKKGEDTCQLIPGVLVHKKGSCISWSAKA